MTATTSDFPTHWPLQRLGDILAFANGVNADKSAYGKGCRFINVLETITYSHLRGPEVPGRVTLPSAVVDAYTVEKGDILFNRTSETDADVGLASAYVGEERVVFGGFVIRGRPVKDAFDSTYAGYALRAPFVRSQVISMGQGAVRSNIGQESLGRVVVPVPPAKEQRAIAKALSDVDALLAGLDRLIAKKRDLKQAAMQQLLTGQTRLPGFDGSWKAAELSLLCSMKSGESITSEHIDQSSTYPCYGGNGVRGFTARFTHEGSYVLIGRQGALCGNVVVANGRFFASEHAVVVSARAAVDVRWLAHVLKRMNLNQHSESSAQPGLSVSKILKLSVSFPPTEAEQSAIAAVLADMDDELGVLETRLNKTRALKQAMMQELLTGRIRLV